MGQMQAKQRLYLTADKKKLVPEGDKKAATLYAAVGDIIPESAADRFGLVDGALKGFKADAGGSKEREPAPNKERAPGGDKGNGSGGGQDDGAPQPDDLAALKGVGAKTAGALAAAGFTTFAAIAAIDAANPPKVDGLPAVFKWADVVTDAKAKAPAGAGE